jgi:hypothetical protein
MTEEEKLRRKIVCQGLKKKNVALFYREFSVVHREWLSALTKAYKERGMFDVSPLMLSSYYKSYEDKQIATLVGGLLLPDNDRVMEQVYGMRKLLGDNPYKNLYENRAFVRLSNGSNQLRNIAYGGSLPYYKLSHLLGVLWEIEHTTNKTLYDTFMVNIQERGYTPYYALFDLFEELSMPHPEYRINLTLMGLCEQGSLGCGLWEIRGINEKLACPNSGELRNFLRLWMPNWNRIYSIREMSEILGFEKETDLYYCMLAYKTLSQYRKKEIGRYLTAYNRLYAKGESGYQINRALKEKLPKIKFEKE